MSDKIHADALRTSILMKGYAIALAANLSNARDSTVAALDLCDLITEGALIVRTALLTELEPQSAVTSE